MNPFLNISVQNRQKLPCCLYCVQGPLLKMDSWNIWESFSDFIKVWLHMLPYGRWCLQSGCRDGAEGGRSRCLAHIVYVARRVMWPLGVMHQNGQVVLQCCTCRCNSLRSQYLTIYSLGERFNFKAHEKAFCCLMQYR